jgi:hypothetical protein
VVRDGDAEAATKVLKKGNREVAAETGAASAKGEAVVGFRPVGAIVQSLGLGWPRSGWYTNNRKCMLPWFAAIEEPASLTEADLTGGFRCEAATFAS